MPCQSRHVSYFCKGSKTEKEGTPNQKGTEMYLLMHFGSEMYGFWAILFTVSIKYTCNLHSAIEITAAVSPVPPPGHPCQQRTALKLW